MTFIEPTFQSDADEATRTASQGSGAYVTTYLSETHRLVRAVVPTAAGITVFTFLTLQTFSTGSIGWAVTWALLWLYTLWNGWRRWNVTAIVELAFTLEEIPIETRWKGFITIVVGSILMMLLVLTSSQSQHTSVPLLGSGGILIVVIFSVGGLCAFYVLSHEKSKVLTPAGRNEKDRIKVQSAQPSPILGAIGKVVGTVLGSVVSFVFAGIGICIMLVPFAYAPWWAVIIIYLLLFSMASR